MIVIKLKLAKVLGTLLLGSAIVGLSACDEPDAPIADTEHVPPIEDGAPTSASSPTEPAVESPEQQSVGATPAADAPAPERRTTPPATSRPAPAPNKGTKNGPAPAEPDATGQPDPHAGHDMGSMTDHDMSSM